MKFVNRVYELKRLEKEYKDRTAKLIIIYGRRRVGKTTLIEKFIEKKESIYFLAAQEPEQMQIREYKQALSQYLKDEFLEKTDIKTWPELFLYLEKTWPKNKKIILAIDEITFIIKQNPSFTSYLQRFWDKFLSKTKTKLILTGSMVGLMIRTILSYESPLYGRRTTDMLLEEFSFKESREFMKNKSIEEQIRHYSITGGIPKYLLFIKETETFREFLLNNIVDKEGFFYREGMYMLTYEFNEPSTYTNILKAISQGNTKLNEVANYTGIDSRRLSSYIDILINLNLVKKIVPVTAKAEKYRGAIYEITDKYLLFWHKFIQPNRALIELRKKEELLQQINKNINKHTSKIFEEISKEHVQQTKEYRKTGTQWGKYKGETGKNTYEIDIVALNEETKEILFAECKWQDNVNPEKIIEELIEKAGHVEWNKEERKEEYALYAKTFKKKISSYKGKKVYCYGLKDIEKTLNTKKQPSHL